MAPKKKIDKPVDTAKGTGFTEVERVFTEQQIADLNRKLARLRASIGEYEIRNEELQQAYDKLDEDRADIISFLKKTLHIKTEECNEFKERVKGLEELREQETKDFKATIAELEKDFTTMKAQLTSENKLLAGKINTLEEFRAIRDDLMRKFEQQEKDFEDQEMKYKRIIYDAEKKFVIGKDKLKKEMEARLLNLAQDFQDASEIRIAASTHRVIRENIALNNQLDNLLLTQAKVSEQNERYKEDAITARNALEVAEAERDKAINKSIVQLKVIDQLTTAFQNMEKTKALEERKEFDCTNLQANVNKLSKENSSMILQIRILEQNLHAALGEHNRFAVEISGLLKESNKYKKVIKDTSIAIQAAMKLDEWALLDPMREVIERKLVLRNILSIINKHRLTDRAESVESLISFSDIYKKGDLGFVVKSAVQPTAGAVKRKGRMSKVSVLSKVDIPTTVEEKVASVSSIKSVEASFRSMPSVSVIPKKSDISIASKESLPSFAVTSLHSVSTSSVSEIAAEPTTTDQDLAKQLEQSKLAIQKSFLKDLVMSQVAISQVQMDSQLKIDKEMTGEHEEGAEGEATTEATDEGATDEGATEEGATDEGDTEKDGEEVE